MLLAFLAFFATPVRTTASAVAAEASRRTTPTTLSGTLASKAFSYGDNQDIEARLLNDTPVESPDPEPEESFEPEASTEELSDLSSTLSANETDTTVKEGITDCDKPTEDGTDIDSDSKKADQSERARGSEGPEHSTSATKDDDSSDEPCGKLIVDDSEDNNDKSDQPH